MKTIDWSKVSQRPVHKEQEDFFDLKLRSGNKNEGFFSTQLMEKTVLLDTRPGVVKIAQRSSQKKYGHPNFADSKKYSILDYESTSNLRLDENNSRFRGSGLKNRG